MQSFEPPHDESPNATLSPTEPFASLILRNAVDDAIFAVGPDRCIRSWNVGAERLLGWSAAEAVGRTSDFVFTPEDRTQDVPALEMKRALRWGRVAGERCYVRKDGRTFWGSGTMMALRDTRGHVVGFAKILRDITERRAAADALRASEARQRELAATLEERVIQRTHELEESNAHLVEFAYTVSHDLRAPVRAMRGYLDALVDEYGDRLDDPGRLYGRRIAEATDRMEALIRDLLEYSRLGRIELLHDSVDLRDVTREALYRLQALITEANASITLDLATDLPMVSAHRTTLMQVIANLVLNAIKFVAPGVQPRIHIGAVADNVRVRFWIKDNGIGIASEHFERIFEPFQRLHSAEDYPGTGVGLAVVRKSIERMGGIVGIESAVGVGSTFWFALPIA